METRKELTYKTGIAVGIKNSELYNSKHKIQYKPYVVFNHTLWIFQGLPIIRFKSVKRNYYAPFRGTKLAKKDAIGDLNKLGRIN